MNAIHREDDGWYYWTETWADRHGPFGTYEEALFWLDIYCYYLDTGLIIF